MLSVSFLGRKLENEMPVRLRFPFDLEFILFGKEVAF